MKLKLLRSVLLCVVSTNLLFKENKNINTKKSVNIISDIQLTVEENAIDFLDYYIENEKEKTNDLFFAKLKF